MMYLYFELFLVVLGWYGMDFFFVFWYFLIKIQEMNPVKTYFQDLLLWSPISLISVTYEGVTLCALA
jgi:hypothetical protein